MTGSDIREAAARVFGLLSDEERRKRRLTTMMDRLREDGFVEPRPARPAQGSTIADAADAIGARLSAGHALRAEAQRQLASGEDQAVGRQSRRATSTYGLAQARSQSPEGGGLQKTQSDTGQFRRLPDNPRYDQKVVVNVGGRGHEVFDFDFPAGTTMLGITVKNLGGVPAVDPEPLPETRLHTDITVGVTRRVAPGLPDEFSEYQIPLTGMLEARDSITYGKSMKSSGGSTRVLVHNWSEMTIELTIGAIVGNPI